MSKEVLEGPERGTTFVNLFLLQSEDLSFDGRRNAIVEKGNDKGFIKGGGGTSMTPPSAMASSLASIAVHCWVVEERRHRAGAEGNLEEND